MPFDRWRADCGMYASMNYTNERRESAASSTIGTRREGVYDRIIMYYLNGSMDALSGRAEERKRGGCGERRGEERKRKGLLKLGAAGSQGSQEMFGRRRSPYRNAVCYGWRSAPTTVAGMCCGTGKFLVHQLTQPGRLTPSRH